MQLFLAHYLKVRLTHPGAGAGQSTLTIAMLHLLLHYWEKLGQHRDLKALSLFLQRSPLTIYVF